MNRGERDELIGIIKLLDVKKSNGQFDGFNVQSVKSGNTECSLVAGINLKTLSALSDNQLTGIAQQCGVTKAPGGSKADVVINGIGYSMKSIRSAPPAIVNHTARPGFENVCTRVNSNIQTLDNIIDEYWRLRNNRVIREDTKNIDANCPFKSHKEFMRPILNYFLFTGTGQKDSSYPAEKIISITDPIDIGNWSVYDKSNALDLFWDKMVFSLRAKKGMPSGYPDNMSPKAMLTKSSVDVWTDYIDGDYRGALHIRTTK